jgi:hypothetical protein
MNKTIKYGFFFLLAALVFGYAMTKRTRTEKYQTQRTAAEIPGQASAVPVQESPAAGQAKSFFSMSDKEVKLKGIDDNRISQDFEKAKKAEQEAIRADAEAVKRSDIEEKKAQSELEKIAQAKEAAAKSSQK